MTPAEIAEFRALLRAQAAPPAPRRGSWGLSPRPSSVAIATPVPAHDRLVEEAAAEQPAFCAPLPLGLADPLPIRPPLFGRRVEPKLTEEARSRKDDDALLLTAPVVVGAGGRQVAWTYETPDIEPPRPQPPASPSGPLAGGAGWSRVRPPSAQRRLLARLEAVFLVEAEGLDARRAAAAG